MGIVAPTLMSVHLTLPGLAGILLICWGCYLALKISGMPPEHPGIEHNSGSMKKGAKEREQPDGMGGIAAVILCTALLALVIIVPARKGASPGSKFFLAGLSVSGIGWGLRQIRVARALDKRAAEAAKGKDDEIGA
jgi:hypothetical protein